MSVEPIKVSEVVDGKLVTGDAIQTPRQKRSIKSENRRLREILCECAAALGNGAGLSPDSSIAFMALLPREIRLVVERLAGQITPPKEGE